MALSSTRPSGAPSAFSDDQRFFGHPRGLASLFFTEMWERFSFYGLRPLLVLFMAAMLADGGFGFDREQASAIVGIYGASVYLASLPGGWVADRLLGLRRAVFIGAVLIALGHLSIGLADAFASRVPFFSGLLLIVLGTGLLKPNISALVGDLYPEGGARRDAGYSIYYMGINLGAFFGQILTGSLAALFGWSWGFGAAGVGMLAGVIIFRLTAGESLGTAGLDITRHADPAVQAKQERTGWTVLWAGLALVALVFVLAAAGLLTLDAQVIGGWMTFVLVGLAVLFFGYMFLAGGLSADEKKRVGVILVLFVFAAIFWSAFEQAPTSLNLFANDFTERTYDVSWVPAALRVPLLGIGGAAILGVLGYLWAFVVRRGREEGRGTPALTVLPVVFAALALVGFGGRALLPDVDPRLLVLAGGVGAFGFLVWLIVWVIRVGTVGLPGKLLLGALVVGALLAGLGSFAGRAAFEMPTTWFQSINSLCIILLAPVMAGVWLALARRGGDLSSPAKFALGLALAGVGFAIMIPAANLVVGGGGLRVSPWWLVGSYLFQSVGELCLSPVGLSSMTKLSPRRFVGQMLGVWFLASAVGNLIGGLVGHNVDPEKLEAMPGLFLWTTVALFVAAGVLALLVVPIRNMMAKASAPTT